MTYCIASISPERLRSAGARLRRAYEVTERLEGTCHLPRLLKLIEALETGDCEAVAEAMRRVNPILQDAEGSDER